MKWQLRALYIMHSIDSFASALIGIFIPIYFITLGFSLPQVFIYLMVFAALIVAAFFLSGFFSGKLGLKESLIFRLPLKFIQLAFLYLLPQYHGLLIPLALVNAAQTGFYWFPLQVIFAQRASEKNLGKEVAKLSAYPQMVSVAAPILGAVITSALGFKYLFLVAGVLHTVTVVPLYFLANWQPSIRFHPEVIIKLFRRYRKFFRAIIVNYIATEGETTILPIFVFLTFKNILSVGTLSALAGAGAVAVTLVIGRTSDRYRKETILKLGAGLMIIIWLLRFFYVNENLYYMLSVLAGFFLILISVPINTINYSLAKGENIDEFIVFREIAVDIGRIMIYGLVLALGANIHYSFLIIILALGYFLFY